MDRQLTVALQLSRAVVQAKGITSTFNTIGNKTEQSHN